MKFSVFFIILFVLGIIFGDPVKDWNSWLYGFVFGLAINEVCNYRDEQEKLKRRQLR